VTTEPQYEETLGGRLAKAAEFIGSIEKDGYNKFHDYEYVTEAAVKRAVGPALRAAGLFVSSVTHHILPQSTPTAVLCETTVIVGMVGGGSIAVSDNTFVVGKSIGSGSDKGDKAAYKAMAGGLKYALTSLFLIPTPDEDAEYDGGKKEPKAAKPAAEPKPEPKPKAAKEPKAAKPAAEPKADAPAEISATASTNAALKAVAEVQACLSEAELKAKTGDLAKLKAKLVPADYTMVGDAFKARMQELKAQEKA
jgi:hypothetical protein